MAIGRGDRPETWAGDLLELRDRALGGVTAPPQGLYLVGVEYPVELRIPGWRVHADAAMERAG
jgi:tRNA pseudouridine38-40 synthase